jgi:hypothetical protein
MKQSLLFIMLLGFGSLAPLTCSKNKATKEEAKKENETKRVQPQQLALCGPVIKVVAPPKA